MDEYDLNILREVQRDNRQPTEKIADKISLSPSAVQRRLKKLRETGIIEAEVAIVSAEAAGRKLTAIVEVTLQRERPLSAPRDEFRRLMVSTPEVMQCYHITGDSDFVRIITAKDMEEYEHLTRRLFVDNTAIRSYKTSIVLKRVKAGMTVPL